VVGLILILVILFVPMGFVGLVGSLKQKWAARSTPAANLGKVS
jgi:hypothetical protein